MVDAEGFRLRPAQIVIRNLLRVVDLLPAFYAVGGICCAISPKYQRLGDIAATPLSSTRLPKKSPTSNCYSAGDTTPCETMHISPPSYENLFRPAKLASLSKPSPAALNSILPPDSNSTAKSPDRLSSLVSFPEETLEGMTDEQYVRNVVDLIYRPTV